MKTDLTEKYKHLIGTVIPPGVLTLTEILDETSKDGAYSRMCLATCRCGRVIKRKLEQVLSGHVKSCGECGFKSARVSEACLKDLTGKTFGHLKVLSLDPNKRGNKRTAVWICQCLYKGCGNIISVRGDSLQSGAVATCGRCGYEQDRKLKITPRAIPISDERALRRRFTGMKQRCYNPNSRAYPDYGGRGIYICDEWLKDPGKFVKWALQNGFSQDLTIERINAGEFQKDQNGPYAPWNCKWVANEVQSKNTRFNRRIPVGSLDYTVGDCARVLNIDPRRASERTNGELELMVSQKLASDMFDNKFK